MKIGILGGGQLSRMLALAGIPLGFGFHFYFPPYKHSLHALGTITNGAYDDFDKLSEFANSVDVITLENENIPLQTIEHLKTITPVYPDEKALAVSQDRLHEKRFFCELDVPTNRFLQVDSYNDAVNAVKEFGYPIILKTRREGYDGKGQYRINTQADLEKLNDDECRHMIAEEFVKFDREVSLIISRSQSGMVFYDICENSHKDGILNQTRNKPNDPIFALAKKHLMKIAQELDYIGTLTVEFFQTGDTLKANEMAPRVHNSGHWTIDAAITSQFTNHLRAITNLPLGSCASTTDALMLNILGMMPDRKALLTLDNACLHDYEKSPAPGRKLGHLTLLGDTPDQALLEIRSKYFI